MESNIFINDIKFYLYVYYMCSINSEEAYWINNISNIDEKHNI